MMTVHTKFTPEVLLSAPRRTPALPNCTGEKALYMVGTYSFTTYSKTSQIRLLDITTAKSTKLFDKPEYTEPTWVSEHEFIFLCHPPGGSTVLMEVDLADDDPEPREVGLLPGFFSNMKVKALSEDVVAVACAAVTKPDGTPYYQCADSTESKFTSAKVYSSLFVRHWDSYVTENKNSLWYGRLERTKKGHHHNCAGVSGKEANGSCAIEQQHPTTHQPRWKLAGEGLTNLLVRRGLECPVPPFGGTGDFDISSSGIAFVARDPVVCPATHTKTNTYFVPLSTFSEASPPAPQLVQTPGLEGYSVSPVFSPCGKSLAFARMRMKRYESDKPRLLLVKDVTSIASGTPAEEFYATQDGEGGWDLRPDWILWSNNGKTLYVAAEKHGRIVLWQLPSCPSEAGTELPTPVAADGSVYDARVLSSAGEKLFVTSTSVVDSSTYSIVTPGDNPSIKLVSSNTKGGKSFGLSKSQFDEFWFRSPGSSEVEETTGDAGYDVHALVMKPSNLDASKKYPLAMLIHGGPQGAWIDSWTTRWNTAVFAEQGYVVVMPNPTGSTGYGMAFQNSIRENWGGRPYRDIEACFRHLKSSPEFDFVDTERAVALGASYGGYMINWIQGHPLGRNFKALVCHDGVFSTLSQFSSEELYFPIHDFGGTLWDNREGYAKWDPATYTGEWATPELVIHNELDYRLPISEGLAAFNVLQSRGVPSRFLTFPDENHWVLKPGNSFVWYQEVLAWINKYSGIAGENPDMAAAELVKIDDKEKDETVTRETATSFPVRT